MAALTESQDEQSGDESQADDVEDIDPETGEITDGKTQDDEKPADDPKSEEKPPEEKKSEAKKAADPEPEKKEAAPTNSGAEDTTKGEPPAEWFDTSTYDDEQAKAHDTGVANRIKGMAKDIVTGGYNSDPRLLAAYQTGWEAGKD